MRVTLEISEAAVDAVVAEFNASPGLITPARRGEVLRDIGVGVGDALAAGKTGPAVLRNGTHTVGCLLIEESAPDITARIEALEQQR